MKFSQTIQLELTRERMSGDDLLGEPELSAQRSHLILVEIFQRLDDFPLEGGPQRQKITHTRLLKKVSLSCTLVCFEDK